MKHARAISVLLLIGCSPGVAPSDADVPDASLDGGLDAALGSDAFVCPSSRGAFVSLVYVDPGTPDFACSIRDPDHEVVVRSARVTGASRTTDGARLDLDFCSPAADDCVPAPGSLTVTNVSVDFVNRWAIEGQFVEIHWRVRSPFGRGCTHEVEIRNLPSWDGAPNPVRTDDHLLFAAVDGVEASMTGSEVTVARVSIGCTDPAPRCMGTREALALSFSANGHTQIVAQGTSGSLDRDGLSGYGVTNVSSFVTGDCDDPGAFGWAVEEIMYEFP